jgi:hypothetical protein
MDLHSLEDRTDCFQRWVAHFAYFNDELSYDGVEHSLHASASKLIREGLCRMLLRGGALPEHECREEDVKSPMMGMNLTVIEFIEFRFFSYYPMTKRHDRGCFSRCFPPLGPRTSPPHGGGDIGHSKGINDKGYCQDRSSGSASASSRDTSHYDEIEQRWDALVRRHVLRP